MKARLRSDYRFRTGTAFAGLVYVKEEWRDVPEYAIEEATRRMNDQDETQLEFKQTAAEKRAVVTEDKPAAETPAEEKSSRRGK